MSGELNECERLATRLRGVVWNRGRDQRRRSQLRLVQEYVRRSALWTAELGRGGWPFFDIAERIDPTVRVPESTIESTLETFSESTYHSLWTAKWALHFAHLKDLGQADPGLPDPYEPLIVAYERGDPINYTSGGFIEIDGLAFRKGERERAARIKPLEDLSEAALREIDERGRPDQL